MARWGVDLHYNGAVSGAHQNLVRTVEVDDPYDAIDKVSADAVRMEMSKRQRRDQSAGICITGFNVCTLPEDPIPHIREAFLNLIADAREFREEYDGDGEGGDHSYHTILGERQLQELCELIGISNRFDETIGGAVERLIEHGVNNGSANDI